MLTGASLITLSLTLLLVMVLPFFFPFPQSPAPIRAQFAISSFICFRHLLPLLLCLSLWMLDCKSSVLF